MSAESAALVRSWPVGRYTATMTVQQPKPGKPVMAVVEWEPEAPKGLSSEEFKQYRAGRNAAFNAMGLTALVIET